MSDSVKKWHEMQEEKETPQYAATNARKETIRKEAYTILVNHCEHAIREANNILDKLES